MDSIELNKIAAAIVCAAALVAGCALAARLVVPDRVPGRTEIPIPGLQQEAARSAAPPAAATAGTGIAPRLAAASATRGAQLAGAQCGGCHSLERNGGVRVGPPLFGIGGAPVAANAAYGGYSPALRALGGTWTADRLDRWLLKPAAVAPGTAMGFPGIADPAVRADVVAFLLSTGRPPAGGGS